MADAADGIDELAEGTASLGLEHPPEEPSAGDANPNAAAAAEEADQPKPAKRSKKKKAKKEFVQLPAVEELLSSGAVPWSIAFTQRLGRHVTASRDIEPGELVLRERAVAALPREKFVARLCHHCFRKLSSAARGAAGDAAPRYCSEICSTTRAALDARMGPVLPALQGIAAEVDCDAELLHMVLALDAVRSLAAVGPSGQSASGAEAGHAVSTADGGTVAAPSEGAAAASADGATTAAARGSDDGDGTNGAAGADSMVPLLCCRAADVKALLTHWERTSQSWRDSVAAGCRRLREVIQQTNDYAPGSEEELRRFAAAVNGNAHGVGASASGNVDQGFGMFPGLSMLNHSCAPSCCYVYRGDVMEVRAVEPIKKGQELSVQYINLLEPRRVRARQLADSKFFACGCARCSSPLAASTDRFLEAKSSKAMYVHELLMCNPYVQNMRSARVILARCARKQSVMTDAQLCCPASEQGVQCDKAGCGGVLLAPQPPADGGGNAAASAAAAAAAGVSEQWTCCECGRQKAARTADAQGCQDAVDRAGQAWQLAMALMQAGRWPDAKAQFEGVLANCGGPGQPHALHVHSIDCRTPLLNCCNGVGDTKGAAAQLAQMIAAMRTLLGPAPRPELCTFLALQHKLLLKRAAAAPAALRKRMKQQAAEVGAQAAAARVVCFGSPDEVNEQ